MKYQGELGAGVMVLGLVGVLHYGGNAKDHFESAEPFMISPASEATIVARNEGNVDMLKSFLAAHILVMGAAAVKNALVPEQ